MICFFFVEETFDYVLGKKYIYRENVASACRVSVSRFVLEFENVHIVYFNEQFKFEVMF